MDQRRLVAALETLVEQGLVRCKKYANKLIVMYNSLADAAVAPAAPPRKKQPARTTAETEAKQLRATIRKHMDRLRHLQAQREKLEELAVLQECQKETLEEWHVLLKAQGDLRTLALACGGECETLLESHTKKRTALEKLQRLYGHMVAAVCEIEGVQPRALCERLKIEVISLPVKRS
ncbi:TELO2-interacting protein 1 homolog isoform X1 [Babesia caballi]|uniref:TELO2-interacting protein 1 homolog isoform X1 n=1 Tax=Babesia caballi TaxID=5871 RepID=A0AAV4LS89_BABCB|nr:TELO2-interacting protein 1 homolog isoform X1 [Babesia caballi]